MSYVNHVKTTNEFKREGRTVSFFSANFLQDSRSWILMPKEVAFYTSTDNKNYTLVNTPILNEIGPLDNDIKIAPFVTNKEVKNVRYVKVIAKNFGKLPEGHQAHPFDGDAFIFIDEITVK